MNRGTSGYVFTFLKGGDSIHFPAVRIVHGKNTDSPSASPSACLLGGTNADPTHTNTPLIEVEIHRVPPVITKIITDIRFIFLPCCMFDTGSKVIW